MQATNRRYVVITPCRDEEQFLPVTIRTVAAQSIRPVLWVIVDDGSTDRTAEILSRAEAEHDFIRVVRREDRGERSVGPGVVDAFYAGLDTVDLDQFEYLCKLDGDLELPPRYFERLMEEMEREPRLGNLSGKVHLRHASGKLVAERMGDENAIGAAKFYRVRCFHAIGGFLRHSGWDGIDGHMCRMNGWIARSADQPELRIVHLRQMGSSQIGIWTGRMRWGEGKWFMGSALYFVVAVVCYRLFEKPYVIGGVGILLGYVGAMVRRAPRIPNLRFQRHLRRYELRSLLFGKRRVARQYHLPLQVLGRCCGHSERP
ncbi:MAG: glycosyltransferase [Phycisphaerae bacterium]